MKKLFVVVVLALLSTVVASAQTTEVATDFTYQGYLVQDGTPVNGTCDLQFRLFDAVTTGNQVGPTNTKSGVSITDGAFTTTLDFGLASFNGIDHWLAIAVDCGGGYETLAPRQPITPVPYAIALYGFRVEGISDPSPDIIGGHAANIVNEDAWGQVISGGGNSDNPNATYDDYTTVGGGRGNIAGLEGNGFGQSYATVSGGQDNTASGSHSAVAGGNGNTASAAHSTVAGGEGNTASAAHSTVAGGNGNTASGSRAFVGSGQNNTASGALAVIGGGFDNVSSNNRSTVGGGMQNQATAQDATVGGGFNNVASQTVSTIAGGADNVASSIGSAIGGGTGNIIYDDFSTIGGGANNIVGIDDADASNQRGSTVGGGLQNKAIGVLSIVGGGQVNTASNVFATVGGGNSNTASGGAATVAGGQENTASGDFSAILGGAGNTAAAPYSFAAGWNATANHEGSFVWSGAEIGIESTAPQQFVAAASGGITFFTDANAENGISVESGSGSWSSVSDRNLKENFETVDTQTVLDALATMPLTEWNYIAQDDAYRHMGVMAQDFYAAFGLGESDTRINTVDMDGVLVAAVQGLYEQVQILQTTLQDRDAQLNAQQAQIDALEARLSQLENTQHDHQGLTLLGLGLLAMVGWFFAIRKRLI